MQRARWRMFFRVFANLLRDVGATASHLVGHKFNSPRLNHTRYRACQLAERKAEKRRTGSFFLSACPSHGIRPLSRATVSSAAPLRKLDLLPKVSLGRR